MLIRRAVRKALLGTVLAGTRLTASHVESHTNGSVTVAMRVTPRMRTAEQLEGALVEHLAALGHTVEPVRTGVQGQAVWVVVTNEEMLDEAEARYGLTRVRELVARRRLERVQTAAVEVVEAVTMVVDAAPAADHQPDGRYGEVEIDGTEVDLNALAVAAGLLAEAVEEGEE